MTKQQISAAILETEKTLDNLRKKLDEPEFSDFKLGDVFCRGDTYIIVMETWGNKFHVIGNAFNNTSRFLRPYSDHDAQSVGKKEMLEYLKCKISIGWEYVGNLGESFDEAFLKFIGK